MGYLRRLNCIKTVAILEQHGFREVDRDTHRVRMRGQVGELTREIDVPIADPTARQLDEIASRAGLPRQVFETSFDPEAHRQSVDEHAHWLRDKCKDLEGRFLRMFDDDPDAAVFEVLTRLMLLEDVEDVRPGDAGGGPDFVCVSKGQEFEVEATVLQIETTHDAIGLPEQLTGPSFYSPFHQRLRDKLESPAKQRQFQRATRPLLLVFGTLHFAGGMPFTNPIFIEWTLCKPDRMEELNRFPVFFVLDEAGEPRPRYPKLSGVLLYEAGSKCSVRQPNGSQLRTHGVLNPGATSEFDTEWLAKRPFCHFRGDWGENGPQVEWIVGRPARRVDRPH